MSQLQEEPTFVLAAPEIVDLIENSEGIKKIPYEKATENSVIFLKRHEQYFKVPDRLIVALFQKEYLYAHGNCAVAINCETWELLFSFERVLMFMDLVAFDLDEDFVHTVSKEQLCSCGLDLNLPKYEAQGEFKCPVEYLVNKQC